MKKTIELNIPPTQTGDYVIQIEQPNCDLRDGFNIGFIAHNTGIGDFNFTKDITKARRFKKYEGAFFELYLNEYMSLYMSSDNPFHDLYAVAHLLAYPKGAKSYTPKFIGNYPHLENGNA